MENKITHPLCSFEVSKMLKEKGFLGDGRPSHATAKEWIRINFGIHAYVACREKDDGEILYIACGRTIPFTKDQKGIVIDCIPYNPKSSPEQADEFALTHILKNLLK